MIPPAAAFGPLASRCHAASPAWWPAAFAAACCCLPPLLHRHRRAARMPGGVRPRNWRTTWPRSGGQAFVGSLRPAGQQEHRDMRVATRPTVISWPPLTARTTPATTFNRWPARAGPRVGVVLPGAAVIGIVTRRTTAPTSSSTQPLPPASRDRPVRSPSGPALAG